jgi:hypothetical protein
MVVPRTPRPPIVMPKPAERMLDPMEIERWVGRLARAIRLRRLEQGFLGSGPKRGETAAADGGAAKLS